MNLPELLKIAEAAKNKAVSYMDFVQARNNFELAFTPEIAEELIKRLQEAEKDARIGKWIIENSSVGGGITDLHATPRAAKFVRFPLIEGDTVKDAIIAAMNGGKE